MNKPTETKYRTHTYQKEDIDKTFVLDRSVEYSQILQEGNDQSVYGLTRLESEDTKYITGVNDTINLSIKDNEVTEYAYDDYGNSEDIEEGFGYNGEHKDRSGLFYLRARYYNPRIGRFLQIDSYKGEDNALATKNRYTYVAIHISMMIQVVMHTKAMVNKNTSSKKLGTIAGVLAMVQVGANVAKQGIAALTAEQERKKRRKRGKRKKSKRLII